MPSLASAHPVLIMFVDVACCSQLYGRTRFAPSSSSSSSSSSSRVTGAGRKGAAAGGLSEEQVEEIKEAFQLFDTNKTGQTQ
jgi:hypothetical protein